MLGYHIVLKMKIKRLYWKEITIGYKQTIEYYSAVKKKNKTKTAYIHMQNSSKRNIMIFKKQWCDLSFDTVNINGKARS